MAPPQEADLREQDLRNLSLLFQQLMDLMYQVSAGEALTLMNEVGLTMPQIVTLHALRHAGSMPIGALAEVLHLSASATSHLVERLVERSFVARTEDPNDRRQKQVAITPEGLEVIARLGRSRTESLMRALDMVDPELRTELGSLCERVISQLSQNLPAPSRCRPGENS